MTIHVWKHWFWITPHSYRSSLLLLLLHISSLSAFPTPEAGLQPSNRSSPLLAPAPVDLLTQKNIQEETLSDSIGSYSRSSPDVDDTFNGDASDMIIPIPVKKYHAKYSEYGPTKKFKSKPKPEEVSGEKVINIVSIKRIVPTPPSLDLNSTSINETDEVLGDEPLLNATSEFPSVQNGTDNYGEEVDVTTFSSEGFLDTDDKMAVAAATSVDQVRAATVLDAGSITGITLGIVVISGLFGAITFVLYRRRYLNKPQVLNDKSSTLDSSGYIDDTSLRENSEEMYSLDNDSFLNSLEAMTIQNYWTESVKHTKL